METIEVNTLPEIFLTPLTQESFSEFGYVVERKDDDSLRLSWDNLQSLCHSCHNQKSADEKRKRNRS